MPAQNGHHQQRRVFRGRGGASDRNIPPKKHHGRSRVKYQNEEESVDHNNNNIEVDDDGCHDIEENVQNLSLVSDDTPCTPPPPSITGTKLFRELKHLNKRIDNVQTSLQTSQLTNPNKWKMNCLLPIRNIVKEWRSILSFHNISLDVIQRSSCKHDDEEEADQIPLLDDTTNNEKVDNVHYDDATKDLLKSTSQKVFSLIQMSMQSGPLVGSNPGYMKRCGGEVASIALDYLHEIVDLATEDVVDEKVDNDDGCVDSINRSEGSIQDIATDCAGDQILQQKTETDNDSVEMDSASDSESSDSSADKDTDIISHTQIDSLESNNKADVSNSVQEKRDTIMDNLQTTLLFTEKQSQRFCQWMKNAKAIEQNKAPSKSAKKLQSQKSKKQTKKEMKVERKLKAKKKQR